jgi:hypothetical protein
MPYTNQTPPTKGGYDFYEVASLLQKSLRRGDMTLAARAANELFPKYTNYIWNRLMTVSAEDCASLVTTEIVALYDGWEKVNAGKPGKDKGRVFIAKAIVILAKCKHARDADELNLLVSDRYPEDSFAAEVIGQVEDLLGVDTSEDFRIPGYVYDIHTRRGKRAGKTKPQFMAEESAALTDKSSVFDNLDQMIDSGTFVAPIGRLF